MKQSSNFLERLAINCLGFGLLVLGIVVAPVPGPGGTPLILAGLAILSVHNHWAYRLRKYILDGHQSISAIIFPANPWARFAWDLVGAVCFGLGLSMLVNLEAIWARIAATVLLSIALSIWGSNHRRAERFIRHVGANWKKRRASKSAGARSLSPAGRDQQDKEGQHED